jgi:hypothetical protein
MRYLKKALNCVRSTYKGRWEGGGIGGCRATGIPQTSQNGNFKQDRFCRHGDIKGFTLFTFQPKSAIESAAEQYIRILKYTLII